MTIESKQIFEATFLTIKNEVGMEVTLSSFGAGIYQILIEGEPMLAGYKDYSLWVNDSGYHGKCVGRIAGRIPNGLLKLGDKTYQLDQNEGTTTLHGGKGGFSFRNFDVDISNLKGMTNVDFYYVSKDLEEGFPGEVTLRIRYIIPEKERKLRIEFKAVSKEETPIDLTIHSYFNLGGNEDILNDTLTIDANEILTYHDGALPDKYIEIPSFADLNEGKKIKDVISNSFFDKIGGLDNAFHKEGRNKDDIHLSLENEKYKLILHSSYDDVVIYTSNCPPFGGELNNGRKLEKHSSVAIEPEYKSLSFQEMLVKEGEAQRNYIEYEFIKKE